jgi:hypothetical protein
MSISITTPATETLDLARSVLSGLDRPAEIQDVTIEVGPDHQGEMALWFALKIKKNTKDSPRLVRSIGEFTRQLQAKVFESGIGLFPYISVEEAGG